MQRYILSKFWTVLEERQIVKWSLEDLLRPISFPVILLQIQDKYHVAWTTLTNPI